MDLEDTMLSEVSHTEKGNTVWYLLYVESKKKKYNTLVNKTKRKYTHKLMVCCKPPEQTSGYQCREVGQ